LNPSRFCLRVRHTIKGYRLWNPLMFPGAGITHKASPYESFFCMVSCRRSKGRKSQSPTLAPLQPPHAFCRDRTIAHYFVMSAIVCAYIVFGFAEWFRFYLYHSLSPKHVTASNPVRHDGANPVQAGCRYASNSEVLTLLLPRVFLNIIML